MEPGKLNISVSQMQKQCIKAALDSLAEKCKRQRERDGISANVVKALDDDLALIRATLDAVGFV